MLQAWQEVPVRVAHGIRVDPDGVRARAHVRPLAQELAVAVEDLDALVGAAGHVDAVKLNTGGQILGVLGSYGKVPGKFDFAIYVAEIKNWRVQKFAR